MMAKVRRRATSRSSSLAAMFLAAGGRVLADRAQPDQARQHGEQRGSEDGGEKGTRAELSEHRLGGKSRHQRKRNNEGEDESQDAPENGRRPARGIENRIEKVGQVVHPDDVEGGAHREDPQRVEQKGRRAKQNEGGRQPSSGRQAPQQMKRVGEDSDGGEDVERSPRLELGRRDEELSVSRF